MSRFNSAATRVFLFAFLTFSVHTWSLQAGINYPQTKAIQTARKNLNLIQNDGDNATAVADVEKQIAQIDVVLNSLAPLKIPANEKQYVDLLKRAGEVRRILLERVATLKGGGGNPVQENPGTPPQTPQAQQPPSSQPKAATTKLRYDQEKRLKDAKYHLSKASSLLKHLIAVQKQIKGGTLIGAGDLQASINNVNACNNSINNAERNLTDLPDTHADVAKYKSYVPRWRETLVTIKGELENALKNANAAVSMDNFPNYAADRERLELLAHAYNTSGTNFHSNGEKTAQLWGGLPENLKFGEECLVKYKSLIDAKTGAGNSILVKHKWFAKNAGKYQQSIEAWARTAPEQFESRLQQAVSMAEKAAKDKRPAFFTGGVQQQMDDAEKLLVVLKGSPKPLPSLAAMEVKLKNTQARLDTLAGSLKEEIIASVKTPGDVYSGEDKAKLKAMIETAWKNAFPDETILAIRFHVENWIDDKGIRWDKGYSRWEQYDRSTLPAKVVIKSSDRIATLYMAFINRNNLKKTMNAGVQTRKAYVVQEMLLSNFKP